jgi:murein DD-endopeptidase MepM/ murein hydrolase activator NlpD
MKALVKMSAAAAAALCLLLAPATAATRFRVPLSMLDSQCANGRCYPTAYFDTNRSTTYRRDWSCRTGSSARTYNQHDGVDIGIGGFSAMDQGRWVMSAAGGTVIAAHDGEYDRCTSGRCGTANYMKIRHADGRESWYWHLKKWSIRYKVGQYVPCGVYIAKVGSSGHATGPHLHFGVRIPGVSLMDDPFGAVSSSCGSTYSSWTSQGSWGRLPGNVCQ